jgi:hypothetical protein
VEITSGGGGKERLDPALAELDNNVYGSIHSSQDAETVARLFVRSGWSARRSRWEAFELTNEWCSFELSQPGDQLLIAGVVARSRLDDLARELAVTGAGYSLELYDDDELLLREIAGGPNQ